jgi:hypothetical protein
LKEKIKINIDCKMQNVDERTVPPIRLAAHIQGAEAKSALYKNGYDAFKNRLLCLKLYTNVAYCIVLDVYTTKSRYH